MDLEFTTQIWQEGNQYIAHAMPLDVMSAGSSVDEARIALDEAVGLFVKTADEMGTLADILQECGYKYIDGRWHSPTWVSIEKRSTKIAV